MAGMQAEQARDEAARALVALAGRPLFGGQDHVALAEAPGSPWFDTLGNALALEALSHPLLAAAHAKLRDGIAGFLVAMEEQGALRRRAGPARLTIASDDTRRFHIETPSHVFTGDLWRGVLRQALRGDPGRPVALHTGNTLSFRFGGRAHRVDVESTIGACGIEPFAGGAVLFHESRILARGLVGLRARRVGALRYGYTIRADTPLVTLTVAFRPEPDVALSDLLLSTALDAMSPGDGVHFDCVAWRVDGAEDRRVEFRRGATPVPTGHADAIAFVQDTAPSRALAIHIRPRDPALLRGLTITGTADRRIHWALARHGGALEIAEDRLVTTGDPRPDADALFARGTREGGRDAAFGPSPGMAAQAIAMHLLWQRRAGEVPDAALEAALARVIAALHASAAKAGATAEDLAFLVLAEDARLRAGHTARHGEALALLLATEHDEGFGTVADNAAALLALSRATTLLPADPRLAPAIARAIAALGSLDAPEDRDRALLLRALRAVQGARVAGVLVLEDAVREAAARLTAREESWLRQRVASPTDAGALRAALLLAQLAPDPLAMRVLPRDRAA